MWPWSSGSEKSPPQPKVSPAETKAAQDPSNDAKKALQDFDPKKLPDREKLPPKLQNIVDAQDKEDFLDDLYEG